MVSSLGRVQCVYSLRVKCVYSQRVQGVCSVEYSVECSYQTSNAFSHAVWPVPWFLIKFQVAANS